MIRGDTGVEVSSGSYDITTQVLNLEVQSRATNIYLADRYYINGVLYGVDYTVEI